MDDFEPLLPNNFSTNRTFCTGFVPLFQASSGTIVLDDAGMLPPGFIPLLILSSPALKRIVITYDSAQNRPPFSEANALSRTLESTCDWLAQFSRTYGTINNRLSIEICQLFGLPRAMRPGTTLLHGNIIIVSQPVYHVPLLAASPRFVETKAKSGLMCFPFADVQGLNFSGDIQVDMGGLSNSASDFQLYTAMTRGKGNLFLIVPAQATTRGALTPESYGCSTIANAILGVSAAQNKAVITLNDDPDMLIARAVQNHLSNALPPAARQALGLPPPQQMIAGRRRPPMEVHSERVYSLPPGVETTRYLESSLQGYGSYSGGAALVSSLRDQNRFAHRLEAVQDSNLKYYAPLPADMKLRPDKSPEVIPPVPTIPLPPDVLPNVKNHTSHEFREVGVHGMGTTAQVDPNGSKLGLRHSAQDAATFELSLKARIHPRDSLTRAKHRKQAKDLYAAFGKHVDLSKNGLDFGVLNQCYTEFAASWLGGRTMAQVRKSFENAPVDWDPQFVKLFLKSQRVKKIEKAASNASKGQIVTDVAHLDLFKWSVWALYVEKMLLRRKRKNVYLHARSNYKKMSDWYVRYWDQNVENTACDMTGWDTGVDEAFTIFYHDVFRSFGVPTSVCKEFALGRESRRCFLGPLGAMQASGDRFTWLCNTMGNMAITALCYPSWTVEASSFSGDDMLLCGLFYRVRPRGPGYRFVPKEQHGFSLEFCGMTFGSELLHVSPRVLDHRATQALEDGRRDEDFWRSAHQAMAYGSSVSGENFDPYFVSALAKVRFAEKHFLTPTSRSKLEAKYPLPSIPAGGVPNFIF
jgi:hypothetical protein